MSGARTVVKAVCRCIHDDERYPWPDYLTLRLTRAHYRSRIGDQRDFTLMAAMERGYFIRHRTDSGK